MNYYLWKKAQSPDTAKVILAIV